MMPVDIESLTSSCIDFDPYEEWPNTQRVS